MTKTEMIHHWFDNLWNRDDPNTIDDLMTETTILHGLGNAPVTGIAGFHDFYRTFRAGFAGIHVDVCDVWESGDTVLARLQVTVAKKKDGPTVTFEGAVIARVENGRFALGWNYLDFLGLLTGLKVVPPNAMATALAPT